MNKIDCLLFASLVSVMTFLCFELDKGFKHQVGLSHSENLTQTMMGTRLRLYCVELWEYNMYNNARIVSF